jgi:hypothetical protein
MRHTFDIYQLAVCHCDLPPSNRTNVKFVKSVTMTTTYTEVSADGIFGASTSELKSDLQHLRGNQPDA